MKLSRIQISGVLLFLLCIGETIIAFLGPFGMEMTQKTPMDYLFLLLIAVHAIWWFLFFRKKQKSLFRIVFRMPEVLFAVTMVMFLFSYIYASNANMDYVQRFAASSGNLRLAPDSTIERLNSLLRYLPLMLFQLYMIVYYRIRKKDIFQRHSGTKSFFGTWGILFSLVSAFCYAVALPSFLRLDGIPVLAWVCMVPLFLVFQTSSRFWKIFYGVFFGVIQTMLCNYWLGTFSLISLQFITINYLIIYMLFMIVLVYMTENLGMLQAVAVPVLWTAFDFLRSLGFLGYPWAMLGTSQYNFLPLIQIASVTGIWGISFLLYSANSIFSFLLLKSGKEQRRTKIKLGLGLIAAVFAVVLAGQIYLWVNPIEPPGDTNTTVVALVQQNTDPRKDDYDDGLEVLQKLTDASLKFSPDLVAWSETAFVPNIRRWSQEDPEKNYYAGLVERLLVYQRTINTWLLTGNDDYFLITNEEGEEIRHDYNASILFSPSGERIDTYHKIHLVPFTEYFPFKKQLPWMYELLVNFDVNLWTPGKKPLVFEHPKFTFSTPICFEDSFPGDVRRFVLAGADVILNISNDFWSLTNVEAKQHTVNALFRSIENRRHFLRATASGVTTHIDPQGRTLGSLPYYEEGFLIAEIPMIELKRSVYTIVGDWFPYLCLAFLGALFLYQLVRQFMKRSSAL